MVQIYFAIARVFFAPVAVGFDRNESFNIWTAEFYARIQQRPGAE